MLLKERSRILEGRDEEQVYFRFTNWEKCLISRILLS